MGSFPGSKTDTLSHLQQCSWNLPVVHCLFLQRCKVVHTHRMCLCVIPGFQLPELRSPADTLTWVVLAVLIFLVLLNALLYYKLWALEEWAQDSSHSFNIMDLQVLRQVTTSICQYNECKVNVRFRHL
jgi:hypothetical protein